MLETMKKNNLYLWLITLLGLITSCSQDEPANVLQTNNPGSRVSLTASLPADFAKVETRTVPSAPANHQLRCVLEVWDEDLTVLKVRQEMCTTGTSDLTFEFELTNSGNYKALLWADYMDATASSSPVTIAGLNSVAHYPDKYYTTDGSTGLQAVEMKQGSTTPEDCDAFYASKNFTKEASALNDLKVTLTRPLTKLTIAEKDATNFGYFNSMNITFSVPSLLNVATGTVSGSKNWEVKGNANEFDNGKDITIKSSSCKTIFSQYFFAEADGTIGEITMEFTATTASGKKLKTITLPAGIPAKRNYCVNAAGSLLVIEDEPSTVTKITVDIDKDWTSEQEDTDVDPKVGDCYYSDNTWSTTIDKSKTAIGVVYWIDPTNKIKGKIMAKDYVTAQVWGPVGVDESAVGAIGQSIRNETDGSLGTQKLLTQYGSNADFKTKYEVFNQAYEANGSDNSPWYIPSKNELAELYTIYTNNNKILDNTLTSIGGRAFKLNTHWSSTENDANTAFTIAFDDGTLSSRTKSNNQSVRCIRAF